MLARVDSRLDWCRSWLGCFYTWPILPRLCSALSHPPLRLPFGSASCRPQPKMSIPDPEASASRASCRPQPNPYMPLAIKPAHHLPPLFPPPSLHATIRYHRLRFTPSHVVQQAVASPSVPRALARSNLPVAPCWSITSARAPAWLPGWMLDAQSMLDDLQMIQAHGHDTST